MIFRWPSAVPPPWLPIAGGVALLRASKSLQNVKAKGDAAFGVDIMKTACNRPIRVIAQNAGLDGAVVARKVDKGRGQNFGYNAQTNDYGDMIEFGVVDPTKVTRTAL